MGELAEVEATLGARRGKYINILRTAQIELSQKAVY